METATKEKVLVPELRFPEFERKWKKVKLGDLVNIKSGYSPSSYDFDQNGRFPFIKVEELNNCEKYQVFSRFYSNSNKGLVPKNAIIFPKRGAAILNNKVRISSMPLLMDSNMMALECDLKNLYFEFLFYKIIKEKLYRIADTSTIPQLNNKHILPYVFNLPTLPEQEKIASFLSAVDKKIQLLTQKVEALKTYKKGVMQKLFSQEIRFKDQAGNPYPNWEEKKLGEVCEFIGGGTPSTNDSSYWDGDIPWVSSSDLNEENISRINISRYISQAGLDSSAAKIVPKGSVLLISRVGVGKLAISDRQISTSQDFTNLICESINEVFLGYYLKQNKNILLRYSQGTSIKGFTTNDIKSLKVSYPCLEEQEKIASFLGAIDAKILAAQAQLSHTQSFKKGLLQKMFV